MNPNANLILKIFMLSFLNTCSFAQGFVGHVNDVHINFKGDPINATLPEIVWITPRLESSLSPENKIAIEVTVRSKEPLKNVSLVWRTGDSEHVKKIQLNEGEGSKTVTLDMTLLDGENILEIVAENVKNGKVSSSRSVLVGKDASAGLIDANRKDYALIFSTDRYENWRNLVNPIYDGHTIETLLKEKYGFITEVVENASREEVLAKLYDYNARKFNVQDQLFIFFSGHGDFDNVLGEGYVVATNSLLNDKGKTTYIPHSVLRQQIDNIKCEHIFLAMDVCFGGTIDPVLARSKGNEEYAEASDSDYLVRTLSKRTRKYLTSGSKEYVSDGIEGKHSPFAAKFVQALKEVGAGNDRILSLTELQTYFLKLATQPRFGGFGTDDKASDFVFVAK